MVGGRISDRVDTHDVVSELVTYEEFGLFHENAAEYGLLFDHAPVVRREFANVDADRKMSALVWGSEQARIELIHGSAQNAHTWDTVALALGFPLVAVDLPGHGHSDGADPARGAMSPDGNAIDVAVITEMLAPLAEVIVGMSLGGLTSIALAAARPDLVRRLVLVDITPGVTGEKSRAISNFVNGPATFPSFDELLARTIEHNPTRTVASLRRGILHNAMQVEDGSWVWRYRRSDDELFPVDRPTSANFEHLWVALENLQAPLLLVRGMLSQSVVDDADVAQLLHRRPDAEVVEVPNAGHSVQGDTPIELAAIIKDFMARPVA